MNKFSVSSIDEVLISCLCCTLSLTILKHSWLADAKPICAAQVAPVRKYRDRTVHRCLSALERQSPPSPADAAAAAAACDASVVGGAKGHSRHTRSVGEIWMSSRHSGAMRILLCQCARLGFLLVRRSRYSPEKQDEIVLSLIWMWMASCLSSSKPSFVPILILSLEEVRKLGAVVRGS